MAYAEENMVTVTPAEEDVVALLPFTLTEPQDSGQQMVTPKLHARREQRQGGVFPNYPGGRQSGQLRRVGSRKEEGEGKRHSPGTF